MKRTYERHGFTLEVTVESDFTFRPVGRTIVSSDFIVAVRVFRGAETIAAIAPVRSREAGGRPFATEADALMSGYSSGRRMIDELCRRAFRWDSPTRWSPYR
jgi:hypothetical protein